MVTIYLNDIDYVVNQKIMKICFDNVYKMLCFLSQ